MKKVKFNCKLSLNKETVANLNKPEMNNVKGGATYAGLSCVVACDSKIQCYTEPIGSCTPGCATGTCVSITGCETQITCKC